MVRDTCPVQFKIVHRDGKRYQDADVLLRAYYMEMMNVINLNTGSNFRNFLVEDVQAAQGSLIHGLNVKMK